MEAELRCQVHARFSLVGFGGAAMAPSETEQGEAITTDPWPPAAPGCAIWWRPRGLHMGIDVAVGPNDPVIHVLFGNACARP